MSTSDAPGAESTSEASSTVPGTDFSRVGRHHIGAVTARTEVSHQTLRHWDEVGLVRPSGRTEGGFRLYSDVDIQRLLVIRRMKPLEFSLDEMKRLLDSLDLLSGADGDERQRREAATFVIDCHHRAEQSIARLRKRLAYASELTEVLAREARRVAVEPTAEVEHPGDPG